MDLLKMTRLCRSSTDLSVTHTSVQPKGVSFHGSTQNLQMPYQLSSSEISAINSHTSPFFLRKMPQ